MKLTNEEIAKVFTMYMPCLFKHNLEKKPFEGIGIHLAKPLLTWHIQEKNRKGMPFLESCKLLLTLLSKITDEHAIEVVTLLGGETGAISEVLEMKEEYPDVIQKLIEPFYNLSFKVAENDIHPFYIYSCFQCLIKKGYAVPLWFGIGHWANGKTAIELEIAIEKP